MHNFGGESELVAESSELGIQNLQLGAWSSSLE